MLYDEGEGAREGESLGSWEVPFGNMNLSSSPSLVTYLTSSSLGAEPACHAISQSE